MSPANAISSTDFGSLVFLTIAMTSGNKKQKLFDDKDDRSDSSKSDTSSASQSSPEELLVNKKYAKDYEYRKQKEELRRVQERGSDLDSEGSSSSEEEDEEGEMLTPTVNLQFVRTIKALRTKDSSIYDPKVRFFEDYQDTGKGRDMEKSGRKGKSKKFKDVLREQILEQMESEGQDGSFDDVDDSALNPSKLAYDEQQQELRKEFLRNSNVWGDDVSDESEDWMVVKQKKSTTKDGDSDAEKQVLEELKNIDSGDLQRDPEFVDPRGEIKDGDKFLIEYIKNKKWIDSTNKSKGLDDEQSDSEASSFDDKVDDFEANYNFRFEQAAEATGTSGAEFSNLSYARGQTMNTLRRKDDSRREKRLSRKERKEAERKAKAEQLKRLKNAKREEMNQKLAKIKAVVGAVGDEAVDEDALMKMLDGDYDPDKFDEAMKAAYSDDFYQKSDIEWKTDKDVRNALKEDEDGDQVVGQDDLDGCLYDNTEDDNVNDDDDVNANDDENEMEYADDDADYVEDYKTKKSASEGETEIERKLREKVQDELYKLDYEDIVAGIPTRFKYRKVEPNSYGLTTEEILLARDSTLKQFVSLKKMAPYNERAEYFVGAKKRRRFREWLKQDIEEQTEDQSKEQPPDSAAPTAAGEIVPTKKRRRLKKGKKRDKEAIAPDSASVNNTKEHDIDASDALENNNTKRRRRKKGKEDTNLRAAETSDFGREDVEAKEAIQKATANHPELSSAKSSTKVAVPHDKKKKKKKKQAIAGLPQSRLASYGL